MRYAQIRKMDISNGIGIGVAIFTQGCPFHCKNCFQPETWDFDKGKEWSKEKEEKILKLMKPDYIVRLTVLGGEPLIERNIEPLCDLFRQIKSIYPDKQIWVYTGNTYEKIKDIYPDIFKYIDILIDGQYVDKLKDYKLKFRGSFNQRIIDVQKSLKINKTVLKNID